MNKARIHKFTTHIQKKNNAKGSNEIVIERKRDQSEECNLELDTGLKKKKVEQINLEREKQELVNCRHNEILKMLEERKEERNGIIKNLTKKYQKPPTYYKNKKKNTNEIIKRELSKKRDSLIQFIVSKIDGMLPDNNTEVAEEIIEEVEVETKEMGTQTEPQTETQSETQSLVESKNIMQPITVAKKEDIDKSIEPEKKTTDSFFPNPKPLNSFLFGSMESGFGK